MPLASFSLESVAAARAAHLRYVSDAAPGIRRVRVGRGFRYLHPDGRPVRDPATLQRIRSLAVPPAWISVWIAPEARAHIQATGRDAKRRKQYIYHPRWREIRDETKYHKLTAFARALPKIRRTTERHLALRGLPREKVLATVVRLLELTRIRIGNEEYARKNGSFGLTTLLDRHVDIDGARLRFRFRGKSSKKHVIDVVDRRLARIVAQCSDLPGQELFQYVDESGELRSVESADINAYLRGVAGQAFTAKDFRTWVGTVLTARELCKLACDPAAARTKKNVQEAVKAVARQLGNTPSVCRKCYVHPAIFEAYFAGHLARPLPVDEEKAVIALVKRAERAARESLAQKLTKSLAAVRRAS